MLHRFRFVIAGILMVLTSAAVSYAVSASMPTALLPAGTTRYATAYRVGTIAEYIPADEDTWTDVLGMTKYITIPKGQTADVMVQFCAMISSTTTSQTPVRATLRDVPGKPGTLWLGMQGWFSNECAIFHWINVTAGSPAIKIQIGLADLGTDMYLDRPTMHVTVNLH